MNHKKIALAAGCIVSAFSWWDTKQGNREWEEVRSNLLSMSGPRAEYSLVISTKSHKALVAADLIRDYVIGYKTPQGLPYWMQVIRNLKEIARDDR